MDVRGRSNRTFRVCFSSAVILSTASANLPSCQISSFDTRPHVSGATYLGQTLDLRSERRHLCRVIPLLLALRHDWRVISDVCMKCYMLSISPLAVISVEFSQVT